MKSKSNPYIVFENIIWKTMATLSRPQYVHLPLVWQPKLCWHWGPWHKVCLASCNDLPLRITQNHMLDVFHLTTYWHCILMMPHAYNLYNFLVTEDNHTVSNITVCRWLSTSSVKQSCGRWSGWFKDASHDSRHLSNASQNNILYMEISSQWMYSNQVYC